MLSSHMEMPIFFFVVWQIQAAREGHREIIELLVEHGVDINERNDFGTGASVLSVAYHYWEDDSSFIKWLIGLGAREIQIGEEL